jgi:signal transduction histidine kinase
MSPQQIEKIFEPFQSNFEGGTGLGLAIVYQIVQAHGGKVWARSKPGQGATFVLRLQRLDTRRPVPADANTPDKAPMLAAAGGGGRG